MARKPLPALVVFSARVRRGQDGFWSIIVERDAKGQPWSVSDIDGETNCRRSAVGKYIQLLVGVGLAVVSRKEAVTKYGRPIKFYRLAPGAARKEPPRFRNGKLLRSTAQEQLWRAMRTLRQFDSAELAFAASTDELKVKESTARRYVEQLAGVGYLLLRSARKGSGPRSVWQLRPAFNTGPLSPAILSTEAIFDRNRAQIMGEPIAVEAA